MGKAAYVEKVLNSVDYYDLREMMYTILELQDKMGGTWAVDENAMVTALGDFLSQLTVAAAKDGRACHPDVLRFK